MTQTAEMPPWAMQLPDPVRQDLRQAVLARLPAQSAAVQALLFSRWSQLPVKGTDDLLPGGTSASQVASPLAELVRQLQRGGDRMAVNDTASSSPPSQLPAANVRRFGRLARQVAVEQQVAKALRTSAAHAGPLNPTRLVQRVLQLMQDLSPEYLHQFMEQMDTVLWLDDNPVIRVQKKKSNKIKPVKR